MKIVPRPTPTAPTMKAKPRVMPAICGTVRRKPWVSPDDNSMMLFGPGVKNITAANIIKVIKSGCDMTAGTRFPLALLAGFRFSPQVGAVQRRVIIRRDQHEAALGEHALDHPAEGRIFVAHMGHHAVARKPMVL